MSLSADRPLSQAMRYAHHRLAVVFLSWPPMDDAGLRIVQAYRGDRIVYVGESEYGCCGTDELFELLTKEWTEVASCVPVQWDGLHDVVTVYDRTGGAS